MKSATQKKNSKYVMIASSVVMGLLGLGASFFPKEILSAGGVSPAESLILIVQITGALYIGFTWMNWTAKAVLIGGIYAKPLAAGNFAHFTIAAIVLIKAAVNNVLFPYLWIAAVLYLLFAVLFGKILFTNPVDHR